MYIRLLKSELAVIYYFPFRIYLYSVVIYSTVNILKARNVRKLFNSIIYFVFSVLTKRFKSYTGTEPSALQIKKKPFDTFINSFLFTSSLPPLSKEKVYLFFCKVDASIWNILYMLSYFLRYYVLSIMYPLFLIFFNYLFSLNHKSQYINIFVFSLLK